MLDCSVDWLFIPVLPSYCLTCTESMGNSNAKSDSYNKIIKPLQLNKITAVVYNQSGCCCSSIKGALCSPSPAAGGWHERRRAENKVPFTEQQQLFDPSGTSSFYYKLFWKCFFGGETCLVTSCLMWGSLENKKEGYLSFMPCFEITGGIYLDLLEIGWPLNWFKKGFSYILLCMQEWA